jgi:vancomycin resistance protein YoaR
MSDIVGNRKAARITLVIMMIALVCVSAYIAFLFISGVKSADAKKVDVIVDAGVVYGGVTSVGVDLSGSPRGVVPTKLSAAVRGVLNQIEIDVAIEEHKVTLNAQDVGASIDTAALFANAYAVGRESGFESRAAGIYEAAHSGVDIPYTIAWDPEKLEASLRKKAVALGLDAQDASVQVEKTQDEENLMCDLNLTIVPEVKGIDIDYGTLLPVLNEKMRAMDCFGGDAVAADTVVTQPKLTAADLSGQYQKIGTFKTSYTTSAYGRRYNIWKMAGIINGVTIQPGETWSINDEAGPRTYARGWEGAPGIENGQYETQAGGGICQVSTTLYNAVLRADLEIVDRTHHSWPSDYVDTGLDATISTGRPDFKFKNNTDSPIIIYARCDGKAKTIEISIYRSGMDYVLDFTSDVVSTSYSGAIYEIPDPTLPPGARVQVLREHPRVVADVYKHVYDLNGNEIETVKIYRDIYSNKPAIVRVGPVPPAP